MNRFRQTWQETCSRLGVNPRQFAVLVAVLAVAVSGLGVRMLGGSRKPVRPVSASAKAGKVAAPAAREVVATGVATAAPAPVVTVDLRMQEACARDPFRGWDVPKAPVVAAAREPKAGQGEPEPGVLPGLVLKAIVPGELAVFGDQTVVKGQSLAVGEDAHARVAEIRHRSVVVLLDDRLIEVSLGAAATQVAKPAAGGFR